MNGTQYPWPSAMMLRASAKAIGRHERGASGGKGGQFARKELPVTGIAEVDFAKLAHTEYNIARVKVAKMKKIVKDAGGYNKVSDDFLKEMNSQMQRESRLKASFAKAKTAAKKVGYKIDSRGNAKPIKAKKDAQEESPRNDLLARMKQEAALTEESVSWMLIGEGGTSSDPAGTGVRTADKPLLCKLADGTQVIRKIDGSNNVSHAHSEVIASRMSALLGIGNVPATGMKRAGENHASSQEFMEGAIVAAKEKTTLPQGSASYREKYREQLNDMFVFDNVIGNFDRHDGNIIQKGGKLYGVDNGRAVTGWDEEKMRSSGKMMPDTNGVLKNSIATSAYNFFGFTNEPSGTIPIRPEVLKRWGTIKKSDFELVFSGLDTDLNVDAQWEHFTDIRDLGGIPFNY